MTLVGLSLTLAASAQEFEDNILTAPQTDTNEEGADEEDQSLAKLFQEISQLRKEQSILLGRVEELEHEIQILQEENRDRYSELDQRVRALSGQATRPLDSDSLVDETTEIGVYRNAIALAQDQKYQDAIEKLESMIERFPNGNHVPDGFYLLGELYTKEDTLDLEQARQNFVQLRRLYPDYQRIPLATYRLGTVYHVLGDCDTAYEYLEDVVDEHDGSEAARLAEHYMTEMEDCQ